MSRSSRKIRVGVVVSDKMDKTVVVRVDRLVDHQVYQKPMRRSKRIKVHDENKQSKVGDLVKVMETRPLSKQKRWRLVEVLATGQE